MSEETWEVSLCEGRVNLYSGECKFKCSGCGVFFTVEEKREATEHQTGCRLMLLQIALIIKKRE
jgi:hypothetical protein